MEEISNLLKFVVEGKKEILETKREIQEMCQSMTKMMHSMIEIFSSKGEDKEKEKEMRKLAQENTIKEKITRPSERNILEELNDRYKIYTEPIKGLYEITPRRRNTQPTEYEITPRRRN